MPRNEIDNDEQRITTVTCDGKDFFSPSGRKVAEACPWNGGGGRSEGGRRAIGLKTVISMIETATNFNLY